MPGGFWLNDRFIQWKELNQETGDTLQEKAAIEFIQGWMAGKEVFHAHTSGSTGEPKKITFQKETAVFSARCTLDHFGLNGTDTAMVCMDVSRIAGMMMIIRALTAGMELRINEPSRNPDWSNGTFTACAPLQLEAAIDSGNMPAGYKCILVGGASVNAALRKKIEKESLPVFETYGMTETLSHIAVRHISIEEKPFNCIQPIELRTDTRDCLAIRGRITNNEWIQTNDRVELLNEKAFYWLGRADNVINTGGIKVQPEKLEGLLATLLAEFDITQFFIHGFPHPVYGQSPVLIVEKSVVDNEEELLDQMKQRVEKYQQPLKIIRVPEFRYSSTGKVLRKETADLIPPFTF